MLLGNHYYNQIIINIDLLQIVLILGVCMERFYDLAKVTSSNIKYFISFEDLFRLNEVNIKYLF